MLPFPLPRGKGAWYGTSNSTVGHQCKAPRFPRLSANRITHHWLNPSPNDKVCLCVVFQWSTTTTTTSRGGMHQSRSAAAAANNKAQTVITSLSLITNSKPQFALTLYTCTLQSSVSSSLVKNPSVNQWGMMKMVLLWPPPAAVTVAVILRSTAQHTTGAILCGGGGGLQSQQHQTIRACVWQRSNYYTQKCSAVLPTNKHNLFVPYNEMGKKGHWNK